MLSRNKLTALVLATCSLAGAITAHVRLHNPNNGNSLYWSNPTSLSITVDPAGSDDIPDDSEKTAILMGMRAWNEDPGSRAQLVDGNYNITNVCAEWFDTSSRLVFFDETNCSGFFGGGSSAVAITPIWFSSNGQILDADVIFNGLGFGFTTSGAPGDYDVQDVGTHELGHLLGLDHSGWAGASMYPYVDQGLILQRSPSLDDVHGLRHAYPQGAHSRINGFVRRLSDNSAVVGAHVSAVDANGRTSGGALTSVTGYYSLHGLDAGDYTVQANPLDGTVTAANLQSGRTIQTDFEATAGPTVMLAAGQVVTAPDLLVDADVAMTLGTLFDDLPLVAEAGATIPYSLSGAGLTLGSTLTPSDPSITIGGLVWSGTSVSFTVSTPGAAVPGHVDLIAQNGADRSVLIAALEVVPAPPTVTNVTPIKGNDIGGTDVTVTGTGFNPGARVIIGEAIYYDGEIGGCTVVDSTTITLTTAPSVSGIRDVVVMDATGVEGRATSAFTVASIPVLVTRFPTAGDAAGGTELVLTGANFQPGMLVRIDSVVQSTVALEGMTTARITTDPGVAGGPYMLEIENPSGETNTQTFVFSYVAQADPDLQMLTPGSGPPAGGQLISVVGSGFTANTTVQFDVDPLTGAGGTPGVGVTFVDANTLEVTTPNMPQGPVAVRVQEPFTGQASLLPNAFQFKSKSSGGGCYTVPFDGTGGRPNPFLGAAWMLLLMSAVWGYSRFLRRQALARSGK